MPELPSRIFAIVFTLLLGFVTWYIQKTEERLEAHKVQSAMEHRAIRATIGEFRFVQGQVLERLRQIDRDRQFFGEGGTDE